MQNPFRTVSKGIGQKSVRIVPGEAESGLVCLREPSVWCPQAEKAGMGVYFFSSRSCSINNFVYSSVSSAMYFMASLLFRAMATNPALVIFAL